MTPIQKQLRKFNIVGRSPLASGFDSMQENGIRLSRKLRDLFFSTAKECMSCTHIRQNALFDYETYKSTYRNIADYNNSFSTEDGSSLILHDPTIFALRSLEEDRREMQGILSAPQIMRISVGGIKPLEKVKYFYEVPSLHFMCSRSLAEKGREALNEFSNSLLQKLFYQFDLHPVDRNVSHYADWSLLAKVPVGTSSMGVLAGYQLSSGFSSALKMEDKVFFEVSASSRLAAAVIGYYIRALGSRFSFPSFIAPVSVNIICNPPKDEAILSLFEDAPYFIKVFKCAGGGTTMLRKAQIAHARNGAPLTLLVVSGEIILQRNIDSRKSVLTNNILSHINEELRNSDKAIFEVLKS